ncbi:hypothetical protein BJ165DRAFT_1491174 [Panaeolus papilionaceus]|nr:hypothetical protein BJ165DRAFT_1491174 [Panaeolus papilionaceus]
MRESMLLETLRHFRQILDETGEPDELSGPRQTHDFDGKDSRKKRALRLAVKETVWYLCSVLHIFLKSPLPEYPAEPSAVVVCEGQKKNDLNGPSEYVPTVSVSEWESREDDVLGAREESLSIQCERDAPKERSKCDGTTTSLFGVLDLLKQLVFDNLFSLLNLEKQTPRMMTGDEGDASPLHEGCQNLSKTGIEFRRRGGVGTFQLDDVERSMFMHVVECYIFRKTLGSDSPRENGILS